ncbi:HYExAFE family protein [Anatilimnocola floriformis]|uniref:HYExAFE family protein n=1 Tax=Anatilimnocola floriformis TaxID=2948575 RepID=UPI0020C3E972|nr:HYExAFE family protein [Anatilimnocola floriformis]
MTKRDNHYEAAFEAYLRARTIPYVAVDETRRSLTLPPQREDDDDAERSSLKSLDFIVSPLSRRGERLGSWLVDIKGRRFPSGRAKQYWKNWSTADELRSLAHWETLFAGQFQALLVFAFNVVGDQAPLPAEQLFEFRGSLYGFLGIRLDHYAGWSRVLSPKWQTVTIPAKQFRALARPCDELFGISSYRRQVG